VPARALAHPEGKKAPAAPFRSPVTRDYPSRPAAGFSCRRGLDRQKIQSLLLCNIRSWSWSTDPPERGLRLLVCTPDPVHPALVPTRPPLPGWT